MLMNTARSVQFLTYLTGLTNLQPPATPEGGGKVYDPGAVGNTFLGPFNLRMVELSTALNFRP